MSFFPIPFSLVPLSLSFVLYLRPLSLYFCPLSLNLCPLSFSLCPLSLYVGYSTIVLCPLPLSFPLCPMFLNLFLLSFSCLCPFFLPPDAETDPEKLESKHGGGDKAIFCGFMTDLPLYQRIPNNFHPATILFFVNPPICRCNPEFPRCRAFFDPNLKPDFYLLL